MAEAKRTRLSDEYAKSLDGKVRLEADRLAAYVITRLAEYLWIHYPDANRVQIVASDVTGRAEPVKILAADDRVLWAVDGPGWEPGGNNGPLQSLAPEDAADRHGARIHYDIALLGTLLPEGSQWSGDRWWPGRGLKSTEPGVDWELHLPSTTERLQFLSEVRLDKEAGV